MLSASIAAIGGIAFYYCFILARVVAHPIMELIPLKFYYDPAIGELTSRVFILNVFETLLASIITVIPTAMAFCFIFDRKMIIYATIFVGVYLLLSITRSALLPPRLEDQWVTLLRFLRPLITATIFFIFLYIIRKKQQRVSKG